MASERVQRHVDRLLDEAEAAPVQENGPGVIARSRAMLSGMVEGLEELARVGVGFTRSVSEN